MIDLSCTRFIVFAWPNNRWPLELVDMIECLMQGVTPCHRDYRVGIVKKDRTCARNTAVKELALRAPKPFRHFVFCDADVRPQAETLEFLKLDADVISCQVPMKNPAAWSSPDSFHEALWATGRGVLEAIEPPWFVQPYNEDCTEMSGCMCQSFREKVLAAGFTIAHGGWAEHDGDGSWHA